jgi:hypothetical protein
MSDRLRHADKSERLHEAVATTAPRADDAVAGSHAMAILAGSYRVVTKSGRLSGGRACALSARVASRVLFRDDDRSSG